MQIDTKITVSIAESFSRIHHYRYLGHWVIPVIPIVDLNYNIQMELLFLNMILVNENYAQYTIYAINNDPDHCKIYICG